MLFYTLLCKLMDTYTGNKLMETTSKLRIFFFFNHILLNIFMSLLETMAL